jgi:hypothetical protein
MRWIWTYDSFPFIRMARELGPSCNHTRTRTTERTANPLAGSAHGSVTSLSLTSAIRLASGLGGPGRAPSSGFTQAGNLKLARGEKPTWGAQGGRGLFDARRRASGRRPLAPPGQTPHAAEQTGCSVCMPRCLCLSRRSPVSGGPPSPAFAGSFFFLFARSLNGPGGRSPPRSSSTGSTPRSLGRACRPGPGVPQPEPATASGSECAAGGPGEPLGRLPVDSGRPGLGGRAQGERRPAEAPVGARRSGAGGHGCCKFTALSRSAWPMS